jgi:hexulose-6-phosphate isomerase
VRIRPSIRLSALPRALSFEARFDIARAAGFEGVEVEVGDGPALALREAAEAAGLSIHSVHCWQNYERPLTSPDPAVRDAGIAATLAAMEAAKVMGAGTLLLVPGVVGADASYGEVYARSQDVIRGALLPEAERLGIVIAVENVWNGFLLSPFDCVRYIEAFDSPFVRLYLDVGNIVFGRPEGWIDIAGSCIAKLHLKDLIHWHPHRRYRSVRVGEGDIDWRRVREALARAGFSGWAVMAEAEALQPFLWRKAFRLSRRLANPLFGLAEARLSRRIAMDSMRRFRRYVAPGV